MKKYLTDIELAPDGLKGFGPLGLEGESTFNAGTIFNKVLSTAIGVISVIGIIWFTFILITGGIAIMTAGGDKQAVENARKRITNGLVGLTVVVIGIFLIRLIGMLLGIEDILNPAYLFDIITDN